MPILVTCFAATGEETQHGLKSDIQCRDIEGLKHNLCQLFPVYPGVHCWFGEKNRVLLGSNTEFIIKSFFAYVYIFLISPDDVLRSTDDTRDDSPGRSVISKSGFDRLSSTVANNGLNIITVGHLVNTISYLQKRIDFLI